MFDFIKYIEPGIYLRKLQVIPREILENFENNYKIVGYKSPLAENLDYGYYLIKSGWIGSNGQNEIKKDFQVITSVYDNYIFISRFHSVLQLIRILLLRLLSFKNPIIELYCFLNSLRYKRVNIRKEYHNDFGNKTSRYLNENPLVSVVIPTLNRYEYLVNVLKDLENQVYKNFEVIICDQSEPINYGFYENWNLEIKLISQKEKALWLARNNAIKQSKGEFIALTEDDVALPTNWINNHLKCIEHFDVKISAGIFHRNTSRITKEFDGGNEFKYSMQFPTGNSVVHRSVFEDVGLFDRQFERQRMGDGEFGLRAWLKGYPIISNTKAFILDIKAPTGGLRQMGSWDAWRPTSLFAARPIPSVLYFIRNYFGNEEAIWYLIKNIPQSFVPYKYKGSKVARLVVLLLLPFWMPIAIISVLKSWKLASDKLHQGDLIEYLT